MNKTFEVKFRLTTSSATQTQNIQASNSTEAKKLLQAQYGNAIRIILATKQLK